MCCPPSHLVTLDSYNTKMFCKWVSLELLIYLSMRRNIPKVQENRYVRIIMETIGGRRRRRISRRILQRRGTILLIRKQL